MSGKNNKYNLHLTYFFNFVANSQCEKIDVLILLHFEIYSKLKIQNYQIFSNDNLLGTKSTIVDFT